MSEFICKFLFSFVFILAVIDIVPLFVITVDFSAYISPAVNPNSPEFIIAFDNDTAGKKGIKNAIELLKQNSIWNYKIIQYNYKDAGEYVEYSKLEELKKLISSPLDIASYMSLFYLNTNDNKIKSKYINSFVSFIYGFPSFVAKDMLIKFEKLTNDKDKFAINLYLKRKTDKEILKFMFYQMQHSKQKLDAFKTIISESILSKNEVKVLEDIAKFNLRDLMF